MAVAKETSEINLNAAARGQEPTHSIVSELKAYYRTYGLRALTFSILANLRARWYLRSATSMGTVRLFGRALALNQGQMNFGDHVRLRGSTVRLEFVCQQGASLEIGPGTFINYGTSISSRNSVRIGQDCNIGQYCIIMDSNYHSTDDHRSDDVPEPIEIGNDVWLGARVIVLKGSQIGDGAVVGANSVVSGTIPPRTVAAGNPARVIRHLDVSAETAE